MAWPDFFFRAMKIRDMDHFHDRYNSGHQVKIRLRPLRRGMYRVFLDLLKQNRRAYDFLGGDFTIINRKETTVDDKVRLHAVVEIRRRLEHDAIRNVHGIELSAFKAKQSFTEYALKLAGLNDNLKPALANWQRFTGDIPFSALSKNKFRDFKKYLEHKGLAMNTVSGYISRLRYVVNYAIDEGIIREDFTRGIKLSFQTSPREYPTAQDVEFIMTNNVHSEYYDYVCAFLHSCFTGFRFSDFYNFRFENISHDGKDFKITQKKTGRSLWATFNANALLNLQDYMERTGRKEGYVFGLGQEKGKINASYQLYLKRLRAFFKRIRLPYHVTSHSGRYFFENYSSELGIQLEVRSRQMGHSSVRTTAGYETDQYRKQKEAALKWPLIKKG